MSGCWYRPCCPTLKGSLQVVTTAVLRGLPVQCMCSLPVHCSGHVLSVSAFATENSTLVENSLPCRQYHLHQRRPIVSRPWEQQAVLQRAVPFASTAQRLAADHQIHVWSCTNRKEGCIRGAGCPCFPLLRFLWLAYSAAAYRTRIGIIEL